MRRAAKKVVLRDALRGWIPDDILNRPTRGFGVPLGEWFRWDLLQYLAGVRFDSVTEGRAYGRPRIVRRYFDEHVHIALWPEVIAKNRTEDGEAPDMMAPAEVGNALGIECDLDHHLISFLR